MFGLIWIGTNDGLNRFEGEKLEIFNSNSEDKCSLVGDKILDIEQDNKFRLWLATAGSGLSYYDYKKNCFKKANINYKENQDLVVSFTIDTTKNTIWAATDGAGIFSYNYITNRKIEFNISNMREMKSNLMSFIEKIGNKIYVGTNDGQIIIINPEDNKYKIYDVDNSKIQSIRKYGKKLLIGTTNHGYFIYDMNNNTKSNLAYNEKNEVIKRYGVVNDIYQMSDSSYIMTFSNGISYLDIINDTIYVRKTINRENTDIVYDYFNCLTVDSKGTEWFGSNGFGLFYKNDFFSSFKTIQNNETDKGLNFSSVRAIEMFDNKLWIGGYGGINTFDLKTKEIKKIQTLEYNDDKNKWTDGIHSQSVYCFYKDPNYEDLLLIGSEGNGMHQYSKSKKKFQTIKFGKNYGIEENINSIFQIKKFGKNLILGTSKGLYAYEPLTQTHSKLSKINSILNREVLLVKSLFVIDNIVYMIIDGLGVYRYFLNESKLEDISEYFPQLNKSVFTNSNKIQPYNDKLLLATKESGLFVLDFRKGIYKSYSTLNGLINDCVYEVIEDSNNNLWVSTNRGISKINLNNQSVTNYNSAIFNLNSEFNSNASLKYNENLFYLGGTEGVVYFNPNSFNTNKYRSNLIIKSVELNNEISVYNYYFVENDTIRIDFIDNLVNINFTTNEYLYEKGINYSCRINNSKWEKVKNNGVKLTGLVSGLNTIEVKIYNDNGSVSETKRFFIEVNRPFWKSNLFLIFIISILFFILYKYYRIRTKKIKNKLRDLTRTKVISDSKYLEIAQKNELLEHNLSNVVWQTDLQFNFLYKSINFNKYYNLDENLETKSLNEIYTQEDLNNLYESVKKLNQFKNKFDVILFHSSKISANNEYSDVTIIKKFDNNGEFLNITGVVKDTKEKNKSQLQIQEKEELFTTLVGTILEPVLITNWEGDILFANNEAKNVLEINSNEQVNQKLFNYLDDNLNHELRKDSYLVKSGEQFEKKQYDLLISGKIKTIEGNGAQLVYMGRVVFLFTFRDVTQRINLIKELTIAKINAERSSELKTMYLSNLTHELKTPINAISGFTDIIIAKYTDFEFKNYLASIKTSTNLLIQLINDLLFYTKAESGKLELRPVPTNLNNLVSELINIFKIQVQNKGVELKTKINNNGIKHLLNLDQLKFKQIIINLLNNAIKYTDHGKINLTITISSVSESQVNLLLIVQDTGIGIPNSRLKEIFNAFKQVNLSDENEGFGLGLAIVKRILEPMNGNIEVESELGVGSKFIVEIRNINLVLNNDKLNISTENIKLVEKIINKDNKLNIYSIEILEDLLLMLNGRFSSKLKNIKTNFLLKDISEFAEQLYKVAKDREIEFVINYSEQLLSASKSIDVEKINNLLENFYKLVEVINKLIEKRHGNE